MRFALELEVFCYTAENEKLGELDMDVPLDDCELRKQTFYNIDCTYPSADPRYSIVASNTEEFVVNKSYKEVNRLIKEQLFKQWN